MHAVSVHGDPVSGHDHALRHAVAAQLVGDPEERDRADGRHADLHRERGWAGEAMTPVAGHRVVLGVAAHRVRADAADRHLGVRAGIPLRRRAVDRARDPIDSRRPRARSGGHVLGARRCRAPGSGPTARSSAAGCRCRRSCCSRPCCRPRPRRSAPASSHPGHSHRSRPSRWPPGHRTDATSTGSETNCCLAATGRQGVAYIAHSPDGESPEKPSGQVPRTQPLACQSPTQTSTGRPSRAPRARSRRSRSRPVQRGPNRWVCRRRAGNRSS